MTTPTFAEYLASCRGKRGLSQSRLAVEAEFDHGYISRLEAGKREPSRETVAVLADALSLDRWDTARLYRLAGYWPPSIAAAAWLAMQEAYDLVDVDARERANRLLDSIWDTYARLEDAS